MLVLALVQAGIGTVSATKSSLIQAKFTGPSANVQWQRAMKWVRENTPQNSIFVHWWDYGYWVEYLGQRPTIADGGHFQGTFRNHMIGRYVLTTPYPETALSFMKSNNISYLLIDPTDLGKYGAYSFIGSDETQEDRKSFIPIMLLDETKIYETKNSTIYTYYNAFQLDGDILYKEENSTVFIPKETGGVIGVILEAKNGKSNSSFEQPKVVFISNNEQKILPARYLYYKGKMMDFGSGLNITLRIIPRILNSGKGIKQSSIGAIIYLSPKTQNSLFAKLYLMDDPFNEYPTIKLAHSEPDPVVKSLQDLGAEVGDFIYYNGFRGPIKIWKVDYPSNIIAHEEFAARETDLKQRGRNWAYWDNLKFKEK